MKIISFSIMIIMINIYITKNHLGSGKKLKCVRHEVFPTREKHLKRGVSFHLRVESAIIIILIKNMTVQRSFRPGPIISSSSSSSSNISPL